MARHGTLERLSRHLRFGGGYQWKDSPLINEEVNVRHCRTGEVLAAGRLEYRGKGFYVGDRLVCLRGVTEVHPKEHKILYNPDYLDFKQEERHLDFGMARETSVLGGIF